MVKEPEREKREMPKSIGDLKLYSVEEVSRLLDIQEVTVRKYLRDGRLQGRKMAKKWFISEDSIRAYFSQPEKADEVHSGN